MDVFRTKVLKVEKHLFCEQDLWFHLYEKKIKANGQNLILYEKLMAQEPIFQLELRVFVEQVGLRGNLFETQGFSWACKNILNSVDL